MAESLFSPSWYRVAGLKPRLRGHAQIHRHQYRGRIWYILQDLSSERFHRFSPSAYLIIGLMDGRHTVREIWDTALAQLGDDAVSQDEVIQKFLTRETLEDAFDVRHQLRHMDEIFERVFGET